VALVERSDVQATRAFVDTYARARKAIEFLGGRQKAYKLTFGSGPGRTVLKDLAYFCRADRTTFDQDPRISAALEGRRDVWLRIVQHLNLGTEELNELYGGPSITNPQQEINE
jgi:hypothetical protein